MNQEGEEGSFQTASSPARGSGYSTGSLRYRIFECLGSLEFHRTRSLDERLLTSLRVTAHAFCTVHRAELAEAIEAYLFAALESSCDPINDCLSNGGDLSLRQSSGPFSVNVIHNISQSFQGSFLWSLLIRLSD